MSSEHDDPKQLTPEQFEELVFLLAHAENSGVVPVRAKDQGIDARLPADHGRNTEWGWQAKRYTGSVNWGACEESIRRARAFWRPRRITFCFPRELSAKEQEEFRKRLVEGFPELRLDFWGGKELKRRMRDSEEGRRAKRFVFGDPQADLEAMRKAAATGGELSTTEQALARLGVVNRFLQNDPHFRYGIQISESGAPQSTPPPGTLLSVGALVEDTFIRLDASERYGGAGERQGLAGAIVFKDEETAREAREKLARIQREGGSVNFDRDSGAAIRLDRVPERLAALFPSDMTSGSVEITARPPSRQQDRVSPVSVLLSAADAEIVIDLLRTEAPTGWRHALRGEFGGLEVNVLMRPKALNQGRFEAKINFQHGYGKGTTMEQLLALELVHAAYCGQPLRVTPVQTRTPLANATIAEHTGGPEVEEVQGRLRVLSMLAEVEAWTGRTFQPPGKWSEDDAKALAGTIPWIREPFREDIEKIRVRFEYDPEAMPEDPSAPHQFAVVGSKSIELFDEPVYLGQQMVHIPRGRVIEINEEKSTAVVVPFPGSAGTVRLFPPDSSTPFD